MTPTDALATAITATGAWDADGHYADAAAILAALPDGAHLFTVESLIDALAGTNINERDRQAYRDIFRTQAEDAIRYAKEAERE